MTRSHSISRFVRSIGRASLAMAAWGAWGLCGVFGDAIAQSKDSAPNLEGIKRADGLCRRDEPAAPRVLTAPPQPAADLSCAVSPTEAYAWLEASDALFVDTRLPADFGQFGLRGAVNLRPADLLSKPYLKSKRIVLFGSGRGDQDLYSACTRLKLEGFKQVAVIRGGLAIWHATQQPMVGRPPSALALARLDAAELWRESMADDNVVMVTPGMALLQANLGFSVLLSPPTTEAIRAILERRKKELKGAPFASVVLVTGSELPEAQFEQMQQSLWPVPLQIYPGTVEAFNAQVARQSAAWTAQARGPKRPACGT